ncbi:MAG: hypothetical protein EP343_01415 [Deltaproteobacteria bacterium]|nr:MAG: hypothetical protein EP343_01415 [Deltaproteobacteria bacterium]
MMAHTNRRWLWLWSFLFLVVTMSCGPVSSNTKIGEATDALKAAEAKDVEAWKWSCFEYYAALLYLKKAREEKGFADFEAAANLAAKAAKYAKLATKNARVRRARGWSLPKCAQQWTMAQRKKHKRFFKKGVSLRDKTPWSSRLEEIHKKQ